MKLHQQLFILFSFCFSVCQAQLTFTMEFRTTLQDASQFIFEDTDGHLLIGGHLNENPNLSNSVEAFLMKVNQLGDTLWYKSYTSNLNIQFTNGALAKKGGYILTGFDNANTFNENAIIVKTDTLGNIEWSKTMTGNGLQVGLNVESAKNGDFLLAGYNSSTAGFGSLDALYARLDSNGNTIFNRVLGSSSSENSNHISESLDGGILICGATNQSGGKTFVAKVDSLGQKVWAYYFGNFQGSMTNLIQKADSNILAIGEIRLNNNHRCILLMELDQLGNLLSNTVYLGNGDLHPLNAKLGPNNSILIAGISNDLISGSSSQAFLLKIDSLKNIQWIKEYGGGSGAFVIEAIEPTNNYIFFAGIRSIPNSQGPAIVNGVFGRIDSSGNLACNNQNLSIRDTSVSLLRSSFANSRSLNSLTSTSITTGTLFPTIDSICRSLPLDIKPSKILSENQKDYSVFPTPLQDLIHFQLNAPNDWNFVEIIVYNGLGQLVYKDRHSIQDLISINTSNWTNGLLIYQIKAENQIIQQGRLIKQD